MSLSENNENGPDTHWGETLGSRTLNILAKSKVE